MDETRAPATSIIARLRSPPAITPLDWTVRPRDVASRWPADRPVHWLHSGRMHPRWARWSIMASPRATFRFDGRSHLEGDLTAELKRIELTHEPLRDLDAILAATALDPHTIGPANTPFRGGWIGYVSYELGGVIEPRAKLERATRGGSWPLIELEWCPDAIVFDRVAGKWLAVGDVPLWLEPPAPAPLDETYHLGEIEADIAASAYEAMVARTVEYIAAGDIFQANIAQRFRAPFEGSTRAFALDAFELARPWYGAYLELGTAPAGRALLSLSPELFLQSSPITRRIVTRPIKGTRPASDEPSELLDSAKDAAELHMIVDLMRNDLGRVCEFGSVRVPAPRTIESHPTVHHGVAEVTGRLRDGTRVSDVLRATFPPGSVTGAPKIRAMQIIDELEPPTSPRGPYCGAIGFFSDCGAMTLNVAIRTLVLEGTPQRGRCDHAIEGMIAYSAGAGIVADSAPSRELQETLDKAAVLRGLSGIFASANPEPRSRRRPLPRRASLK